MSRSATCLTTLSKAMVVYLVMTFLKMKYEKQNFFVHFFLDIDECVADTHRCPSGTQCLNTEGGYNCVRNCTNPYFQTLNAKVCQGKAVTYSHYGFPTAIFKEKKVLRFIMIYVVVCCNLTI